MRYRVKVRYKPFLYLVDFFGSILFFWKRFFRSIDKKKIREILVIRLDHIGDMVLTSSFIYNLKRNFPNSRITILCHSSVKPIAELIDGVDDIITLNVPWFSRSNTQSYFDVIRFAFSNYKKFDLGFELHSDPRNIILGSILSKKLVGYGIRGFGFLYNFLVPYDDKLKHVVERNLDILRFLGLKVYDSKLRLRVDPIAYEKVSNLVKTFKEKFDKLILINVGVGAKERDWGEKNFKELVELLVDNKNFGLILVDSKNDRCSNIEKEIKSDKILNLCGKLNLKELVALTSIVDLVVGQESMNIHVAAALNKKIVYVHSSVTYVDEWGPYGVGFSVLQKLPVDPYYDSIKAKGMIQSISPTEIFSKILEVINKD